MFSAHLRNHAKTAGVITAFGNLNVGSVRRREPEARRVVVRNVPGLRDNEKWRKFVTCVFVTVQDAILRHNFLHDFSKLTDLIQADERIHLWKRLAQLA